MNPRLIEKIRRIADDVRGDPNIRAIAQRKLAAYRAEEPKRQMEWIKVHGDPHNPYYPPNPPNPRTQPSEEYEKFRFMNMDNWRTTNLGTLIITIKGYRIGLFKFKKILGMDEIHPWRRYRGAIQYRITILY